MGVCEHLQHMCKGAGVMVGSLLTVDPSIGCATPLPSTHRPPYRPHIPPYRLHRPPYRPHRHPLTVHIDPLTVHTYTPLPSTHRPPYRPRLPPYRLLYPLLCYRALDITTSHMTIPVSKSWHSCVKRYTV
eukprot:288031-Prorocentrum_minimum.AAC.4